MLRQLQEARRFDPAEFAPLLHDGNRVGWLRPDFAQALNAFPEAFSASPGSMAVLSVPAMEAAVTALAGQGWVTGWRDERYPVVPGPGGPALFELERAAFRRFGMLARASHLNGWTLQGGELKLWVARRSAAKPIDPGMLDNLVGGGIAAGLTAEAALMKECFEEAGIGPALAQLAVPQELLRVTRAVATGLHDELIHAFDLELPDPFVPKNQDGEVAGFMLLSADEVMARLSGGEFTVDAGAVTADFLWRRGFIADPRVGEALDRLRKAALPA